MKPLMIITGPTASGKTAAGIALAQQINGEIISADSMQIYRGMTIGTAKPTAEEMQGIPHHMIDIADPQRIYSVARYVEDATAHVEDSYARGKTPIVVGGTGLYIDALVFGRTFAAAERDDDLRQALSDEYDQHGGQALLETLRKVDPAAANRLYPGDKRRIIRALEVYRLTGETITKHDEKTRQIPPKYAAKKVAITAKNRAALYQRIDDRVDQMIHAGLVNEVKALLAQSIPPSETALQAIGYKEIVQYLAGHISLPTAVEQIKQGSRRYAKRQLTWIRRDPSVIWAEWENQPDPAAVCDIFASNPGA